MLRTLHIFNPWHDEALAAHSSSYMPTLSARRLGVALGELPRWWMQPEDVCLKLPESMKPDETTAPDWKLFDRIEPWGWNLFLVRMLRQIGAPSHLLPDDDQLDRWRTLSSRQTGIDLLRHLNAEPLPPGVIRGESRWCTSWSEVEALLKRYPEGVMLKQPWSSSGRGVFSTRGGQEKVAEARARRCMARQGGIEVQPWYRRLADGALEFWIDDLGKVSFMGFSLFSTAENGTYSGHLVARSGELRKRFLDQWKTSYPGLSSIDLSESLAQLVERLRKGLCLLLARRYSGPLGIDVLFTPEGLHPCIELNLRRTMGHVALLMADRLASSELPSTLTVGLNGWSLKRLS